MSNQVSARIDDETKRHFYAICDAIGISPSNALSIFIKGVINHNGIPFPVVTPSGVTKKMSRADVFGCMRGEFRMADDFDAPLSDFKEYME